MPIPKSMCMLVEVCYHVCGRGSQMEESMYANDFFKNVKSILMNELVPTQPDRPDELRRVEALGGRILCWDCPRVLGVLSTSRSFGDYLLKPYISSDPELTVTGRTEKDEFLILASDGLWDVISSEMACRVIGKCLEVLASDGHPCGVANSAAKEAAAVLVRLAISRGSVDNISVVVVKL
ncbi:phosphatase 2C [Musa troglodytarum]|uniref:protein-serine/threonine phosphatase n=1 Tax=Musa troglodytarum TaxID=320322 RepID=A0A9E7EW47_9LILI|nr:phosphatase 2C [Musa troglodytarum]